jgi:hypothetical protein
MSEIDEVLVEESLSGSSMFSIIIDKKTGDPGACSSRQEDALTFDNQESKSISAVICYQRIHENIKIKLQGEIIRNPFAINRLTETELDRLKKIFEATASR